MKVALVLLLGIATVILSNCIYKTSKSSKKISKAMIKPLRATLVAVALNFIILLFRYIIFARYRSGILYHWPSSPFKLKNSTNAKSFSKHSVERRRKSACSHSLILSSIFCEVNKAETEREQFQAACL